MSRLEAKRYAAYKDSGVEWLGEVPLIWKLQRHKDTFQLITLRCTNPSYLKVALENIEGKTGRFISSDSDFEGDGIQFKRNDILFGKLRPYLAKVYLAEFSGNAIGDIFVYRSQSRVSPQFATYLLRSDRYIDMINSSTSGAKMPRASAGFIADLPIAIPSLSEQTAIADYLDIKTAQIDKQIELLSKKATQYGKLKQSLINETVTRGLDKSVPMKDSGVEWIGDVPAHWEVKRIKDITLIKRGASPRPIDDPIYFDEYGEYSWVRIADLTASERYLLNTKEKLSVLGASLSVKRYPGNFFLSIAGTVGKPIITKIKCCIHDGFVWFPDLKINHEFLYYIFSTGLPYQGLGKLGTQLNLNTETVGLISIPIPSLFEIECIVKYLDAKISQIDRIVTEINTQIDKLKELRKALINDVVTGKIKVVNEEQAV
jgi:type I restriction enzyme S subunit